MRRLHSIVLAGATALVAAAALLAAGCADKVVGPAGGARVRVPLQLKAGAATTFRVTVTAADMDTLTALLQPGPTGAAEGILTVPMGADRLFTAEALDDLGNVLYRGQTRRSVGTLGALVITIDMRPVVPMLYFSPHFASVATGSGFDLVLRAANLPGMTGVEVSLLLSDRLAPVTLDSVTATDEVLLRGASFYDQGLGTFSLASEIDPFVDANGNADLAVLHFSTRDTWQGDQYPVQFDMLLNLVNGVLVLPDDVHLDRAQVRLVRQRIRETFLGSPFSDGAFAVRALPGGDFAVAGAFGTSDPVSSFAPWLARLTADGAVRFQHTFPSQLDQQEAHGLDVAPDGSFYLVGYAPALKAVGGAFAYRATADGTLLFEEPLGSAVSGALPTCVAALPGGGAVAGGYFPNDGYHRFAVLLDGGGLVDVLSVTDFSADQLLEGMAAVSDTALVAVGTDAPFSGIDSDMVLWPLRVRLGQLASAGEIRFDNGQQDDQGHAVARAADGGFFLAGSTWQTLGGVNQQDMWVVRTDASGNELWRAAAPLAGNQEAFAVVPTTDGGCVVAGHGIVPDGAGGIDVVVARLGAGGGVSWVRSHGGVGTDEAYGVARRAGGGYLVAGRSLSGGAGGWDALLLRLDEAGLKVADD